MGNLNKDKLRSILIAWIETEGSIIVHVSLKNGKVSQINPKIEIYQKEILPLQRLQEKLGFGKLYLGKKKKSSYLCFNTKNDQIKLWNFLKYSQRNDWFTWKYELFLKWKDFMELWNIHSSFEKLSGKEIDLLLDIWEMNKGKKKGMSLTKKIMLYGFASFLLFGSGVALENKYDLTDKLAHGSVYLEKEVFPKPFSKVCKYMRSLMGVSEQEFVNEYNKIKNKKGGGN